MNHQELQSCLSLLRLPGAGPGLVSRLLREAESPGAALCLPDQRVLGLGMRAEALAAYRKLGGEVEPATEALVENLERHQAVSIMLTETSYPPALREIACPPPVLFVRGSLQALLQPQIAMVGSRRPTPGGRKSAWQISDRLSKYGLTITSGLASGIDSEAHGGAVKAGGCSIAVMGTGPERIYPTANRGLADAIIAGGGALVSEFLPGTPPQAANFPRRNRIISGLSLGVLVVEAAVRSGSLITARYAAEQDREVMALPGSVHNALSRGCHMLLRHGAGLVETAEDVVMLLGDRFKPTAEVAGEAPVPLSRLGLELLSADQRRVLASIGHEESPIDVIADLAGLDAGHTAAALTLLEMQGLVIGTGAGFTRAV